MITDEIKSLMDRIGYQLNTGPRTGWYNNEKELVGVSYNELLKRFRNYWKPYFLNLGKTELDFDEWSEQDIEIWDTLRAIEYHLFKDDESQYTYPWE